MSLERIPKAIRIFKTTSQQLLIEKQEMDLLNLGFLALELRNLKPNFPNFSKTSRNKSSSENLRKTSWNNVNKKNNDIIVNNSNDNNSRGSIYNPDKRKMKNLPIISLNELARHDCVNDCWLAIDDYIYDCTDFIKNHPGGVDIVAEYAGRDATIAFVGSGHSKMAFNLLDKYLIGELPIEERLFRKGDGIKILINL